MELSVNIIFFVSSLGNTYSLHKKGDYKLSILSAFAAGAFLIMTLDSLFK